MGVVLELLDGFHASTVQNIKAVGRGPAKAPDAAAVDEDSPRWRADPRSPGGGPPDQPAGALHQLGIIGFHVDAAEDGQEALELFTRQRYGVVLTDLNMPVMCGFELARAIRRLEGETALSRTPIVALSANVVPGEAEKCTAAGMDGFLGKPAPMPALADKLREWMPDLDWTTEQTPIPAGAPDTDVSAPSGDGVIDGAALDELTGGDTELAATILVDYVDSLGTDLAALGAALADASADDLRRHAHRIKGASRTVGAEQVATLAARLEAAASAGIDDWDALRSTADDLDVAVGRVAVVIASPGVAP